MTTVDDRTASLLGEPCPSGGGSDSANVLDVLDAADGLDGLDVASLRAMDLPGLERLAGGIRRFLVDSVAATGGHLGSNLGIVELTLALHRVFDSPDDALVWDTGHQAYVHKLVTGRGKDFAALRQHGGLSGYPNRTESPHDVVENSHASTALSYAYGLARARQLRGDSRSVVAVIGDGALTGGLAYEALNNIGTHGTPVVVVLNDNGRSYAPTVSRLAGGSGDETAWERTAAFVEALGLAYRGPVDGHDIEQLEVELRKLAGSDGPVVLHVRTVKGRGYLPAESDEEKCLHDIGPFDTATGRQWKRAGTGLTYTQAFTDALLAEAEQHPELVALTAAMPGATGLAPFADRHPDRFFDVGIAEQHAVATAAGMAMEGLRPVVAIYSTFLNRAWDQIYYDVGLHRLPVVFCIDRAGITGDDGPSHHGLLDLALLTKVPGMTVFTPSSYDEVAVMLHEALTITSGPVAIRWPKTEASRSSAGSGFAANRLRAGTDICLLGVGKLVASCIEAADLLAEAGIDATVWDVRVASPLDPAMIIDAANHPVVLTAEDGVIEGGVGALIASSLVAVAGPATVPPVIVRGVPVTYVPHGSAADLLTGLGLDGPGISHSAREALAAVAAS